MQFGITKKRPTKKVDEPNARTISIKRRGCKQREDEPKRGK
jgi:hypothetical protein